MTDNISTPAERCNQASDRLGNFIEEHQAACQEHGTPNPDIIATIHSPHGTAHLYATDIWHLIRHHHNTTRP